MYEYFLQKNEIDPKNSDSSLSTSISIDERLINLFAECGGTSISRWLYKVHTPFSFELWRPILNTYFPNFKNTILPFGFDWLGRQYCILSGKDNIIVMLDPADIEGYTPEGNLDVFHNTDLVDDRDETVSEVAYGEFLKEKGINKLSYNECAGHKIPLFLDGIDDFSNYHVVDLEVHWEIQYQLYVQVRNLPQGTPINTIKFEKGRS